MMRQWNFVADMNFDGLINATDVWLWLKWLFFYPGDFIMQYMLKHAPLLAKGLEVTLESFGGAGSGVLSLWVFMAATMVCEATVLKAAISKPQRPRRLPVRNPVRTIDNLAPLVMLSAKTKSRKILGREPAWYTSL
jgi:hypothetical protein